MKIILYFLMLSSSIKAVENNDFLIPKEFLEVSENEWPTIEFPDLGGIPDFNQPETVSNQLFILTNPKSGSHLLMYSLIKLTQRPLRGRVPIWHFYNDPPFLDPENLMGYPMDFSKPTTYWGHEYYLLKNLNLNGNKLIFNLRNPKETICSNLVLGQRIDLENELIQEVLNEGMIFKEYMIRLRLFDSWNEDHKLLINFEDLVYHPEIFVPQVLKFLNENVESQIFIDTFSEYKKELTKQYVKKGNETGSKENLRYFSDQIKPAVLKNIDFLMKKYDPYLWNKYLKQFAD